MKVFVTGGGTGGHLFPAIALGEELLERGYDVHLITDTRCSNYIKDCKLKKHILYLGFQRKGFMSKILLSSRMILAVLKCIAMFAYHRPQIVVGFGGYTAFPALAAAKLLFIPIMLHEQNCFLGKVNDMFARTAVKLALNFAETTNVPVDIQDKIVIAGTPVRKDLRAVPIDFKIGAETTKKSSKILKVKAPTSEESNIRMSEINLFITGGSQAAQIFSEIVPVAIEILHTKIPELKINIVQQAKGESSDHLHKSYKLITENAEVEEFFYDMPQRFLKADLVICRSGASTIAELIHTGTPAIMIPLPSAAEDHQTYNAKVIEEKGAGWVFAQSEVTAETLADKIIELINDKRQLQNASSKLLSLILPSERILADTIEKIIND